MLQQRTTGRVAIASNRCVRLSGNVSRSFGRSYLTAAPVHGIRQVCVPRVSLRMCQSLDISHARSLYGHRSIDTVQVLVTGADR